MNKLNILGSTSLIGNYFIDSNIDYELDCFSRHNKKYIFLDLEKDKTFSNICCENSFLVSFAPIWLVKNLFIKLAENDLSKLRNLKGVIIYSSSSAVTKKFASNDFDKNLSKKLILSEEIILSTCKKYSINCIIVRPTIVYGSYKGCNDKNYTGIIKLFKKLPFCVIPSNTGYRQPIHFSELSHLTYVFLKRLINSTKNICELVEVGGDEELTYKDLLFRLANLSSNSRNKRCRLIPISNKIFYLLITPLLFFKPKLFEEIYRMQSDLSGFPKYSYYTENSLQKFPKENF